MTGWKNQMVGGGTPSEAASRETRLADGTPATGKEEGGGGVGRGRLPVNGVVGRRDDVGDTVHNAGGWGWKDGCRKGGRYRQRVGGLFCCPAAPRTAATNALLPQLGGACGGTRAAGARDGVTRGRTAP